MSKGTTTRHRPRLRVRWVVFTYLFAFAFVAYVQRTSFSVAAVQMMPELGISQIELGWLMTAYLVTYTVFQLPGGVFGEWLGARRALVITGLVGLGAAVATPLAPLLLAGTALFVVLLIARLLLGTAHAPLFPVSVGAIESWFPVGNWAFPNGLQTSGLQLGSAAATPLIAILMESYGWKHALLWTSFPALALIVLWSWYGRNTPAEHPAVTAEERAELHANTVRHAGAGISRHDLLRVLGNRDVLLLAISYTIMNYVFYLLEHLVLFIPRAGASPVGAAERMAREPPVHRRGHRRRSRRQAVRSPGYALWLADRLPRGAAGGAAARGSVVVRGR